MVLVEMILLPELPQTPPPNPKPLPEPEPKPLPRPNPEQLPNPPPMVPALAPPPTTAAGETQRVWLFQQHWHPGSHPNRGGQKAMEGVEGTYRCSGHSGILQTFCGGEKEQ